MKKAKLILTIVSVSALAGGALAAKSAKFLYYSTGLVCVGVNLTTTAGGTQQNPPPGSLGWFTDPACTSNLFVGYTTND